MTTATYTAEAFTDLLAENGLLDSVKVIDRWLARGDGAAVYENVEVGRPELGHVQLVSFGSTAAQLEVEVPPERLPDIGTRRNCRYRLVGVYRPTVKLSS